MDRYLTHLTLQNVPALLPVFFFFCFTHMALYNVHAINWLGRRPVLFGNWNCFPAFIYGSVVSMHDLWIQVALQCSRPRQVRLVLSQWLKTLEGVFGTVRPAEYREIHVTFDACNPCLHVGSRTSGKFPTQSTPTPTPRKVICKGKAGMSRRYTQNSLVSVHAYGITPEK